MMDEETLWAIRRECLQQAIATLQTHTVERTPGEIIERASAFEAYVTAEQLPPPARFPQAA